MFKMNVRSTLRSNLRVSLLAATTLLAGATHASDLSYWYYDEFGVFNPGDLSIAGVLLKRPAWACAMRADSGKTMQWIGDDMVTIGTIDSAPQFKAQSRGDVNGCRPKPAIERMDNTKLWPRDENNVEIKVGFHSVRYEAKGNRWIDKNGGWPACNCALPGGFTILVSDTRWQLLDLSFKAQRERAGSGRLWNTAQLSQRLLPLQRSVTAEVSRRRLALFGDREETVRQLEDIAISAMDKATLQVEVCRSKQTVGAAAEAYRSCSMAQDSASLAKTALRMVQDEVSP